MWKKGTRLTNDPTATPILASDVTLGSVFHVIPEGLTNRATRTLLEQKAKAAVLLMRLHPEHLHVSRGPQELELQRHRRVLEDLHPRRLPGRAVRAADAPPAVPLPPVAVRHHGGGRGHLRPGQASAAAAADHRRQRGLPGRAERLPRTRRPELLGAPLSTTTVTAHADSRRSRSADDSSARRRTTSTSAPASPASSRSSAARSSRTTGRSCSARSRCTASSSSCSPAPS